MSDLIRRAAKAVSDQPAGVSRKAIKPGTMQRTFDQRAVRSGDVKIADEGRDRSLEGMSPEGLTVRQALADALRNPFTKVGNSEYTRDLPGILSGYAFHPDPLFRAIVQAEYARLSPKEKDVVNQIITAGMRNAQSNRGVSSNAKELLQVLTGGSPSPERQQAIAAAAKFEGFETEGPRLGADPSEIQAPADLKPSAKSLKENELLGGGVQSGSIGLPDPDAFSPDSQRAASRTVKDIDDRPRFRTDSVDVVAVPSAPLRGSDGIIDKPRLAEEEMQDRRDFFPEYYESLREDFRRQLTAPTLTSRKVQGEFQVRKPAAIPEFEGNTPEEIAEFLVRKRGEQRSRAMAEVLAETAHFEGMADADIAKALEIRPEDWPGLQQYRLGVVNKKYPDYQAQPLTLERDADRLYQIRRHQLQPEGVEQAVNRRYPPLSSLTPQQIEGMIQAEAQIGLESKFQRIPGPAKAGLIPEDKAAFDAARSLETTGRLTEGERRALSPREGDSKNTWRDSGERSPAQDFARHVGEVLGGDPWMQPREFNSLRSGGKPAKKPGNIMGLGQNSTRRSDPQDTFEVTDDTPAFDADETRELDWEPKGKEPRGASPRALEAMSRRSMELLYKQILRTAGVADEGKTLKEAVAKSPAAHGFGSPREMAKYVIRMLEKVKPVPPRLIDQVEGTLAEKFAERWGEDLGRDSLAASRAQRAQASAARTQSLRDRLAGKPAEVKAEPAPGPQSTGGAHLREGTSQDASRLPTYQGRWPQGYLSQRAASGPIETAGNRRVEPEPLAQRPDFSRPGYPPLQSQADDDVMDSPDGLDGFFPGGLDDFIRRKKQGQSTTPSGQAPAPTQVGQPDPDVVDPSGVGGGPDDVNALLRAADEAEAPPTDSDLQAATPNAPRGQRRTPPDPRSRPQAQPQAAAQGPTVWPTQWNKYLKEAEKNLAVVQSADPTDPKFASAIKFFNGATSQLEGMKGAGGGPQVDAAVQAWNARIVAPFERALAARFPDGIPEPKPLVEVKPPAPAAQAAPPPSPEPAPSPAAQAAPPPSPGPAPSPATPATPQVTPPQDFSVRNAGQGEFGPMLSGGPEDWRALFAAVNQRLRNIATARRWDQEAADARIGPARERELQEAEALAARRASRGEDFEDLPVPEARAAQNADASKASKDAESDKATAVAAQSASEANAAAVAKRTEDAVNSSPGPQGAVASPATAPAATRSPGFVERELGRLKNEELGYFLGLPFRAARSGIGFGLSRARKNLPAIGAVAGGLYVANQYRDSLPEWMRGPVQQGAEAMTEAGRQAARAAEPYVRSIVAGLTDDSQAPANVEVPVPQEAEILSASLPGDGPMDGDEGINMVPMGASQGFGSQDSLDRIRRIISATQPKSRYQPGTAQRPTAY